MALVVCFTTTQLSVADVDTADASLTLTLATVPAHGTLYKSGLLLEEAKAKLVEDAKTQPDVQRFVDFLEVSKRGIIR